MNDFSLSNITRKVKRYKLVDDSIKMQEYRLLKQKERQRELVSECQHEILLNLGSKDTLLIGEEKIRCLLCDSVFAKESEKNLFKEQNIIDLTVFSDINEKVLINEIQKFMIELYEEYQNKLTLEEIKTYIVSYVSDFNYYLEQQNLKELGDKFEEDTYEIMCNHKRKIREKRVNKNS